MEPTTWLSADQMTTLRHQLERMREELRSELHAVDDESHRLRLSNVQAALMRFEGGTYGECARCEEPIGFERLHDRPDTAICSACQDARRRVVAR